MNNTKTELIPLLSIKNGASWFVSLFPFIYLLAHPIISIISAEVGFNFIWKITFQFLFLGIYYFYLVREFYYFKSIQPDFNNIKLKPIYLFLPGVFLYERAAIIQRVYDRRLPYLESMWWIWFFGMAFMYWTVLV